MRTTHHTKTKADIGLTKVIADLTVKGFVPCIPLSEHQPYDLVVVGPDGEVLKLQVKYAASGSRGAVEVRFRRNWADRNGTHSRPYSVGEFDIYAVYCPEHDLVLYVPNEPDCPKVIRFGETGNSQRRNVHPFREYLQLRREPSETIRRTPEMAKT